MVSTCTLDDDNDCGDYYDYEDDEDLVVIDKEVDVSGDFDNYGDGGDIGEQRRREPACRR